MRKFFVVCKITANKKLSEKNILTALKSQNNFVFFDKKEDAESYCTHNAKIRYHHKVMPVSKDNLPVLDEVKPNKFIFTWKNGDQDEKVEFEYTNNQFNISSSNNLKLKIQKNDDEDIEIIRWINADIYKFIFNKGKRWILTKNEFKETYIIQMIENFIPIDAYSSSIQKKFTLDIAKKEKQIIVEVELQQNSLDLFSKRTKSEWAEETGKCIFTNNPLPLTEERIKNECEHHIQYLTTNSPNQDINESNANFNIFYRMSDCRDFLSYNYAYEPGKENNKITFSPIHKKLGLLKDYINNENNQNTESQLLKVIKIDELHNLFAKLKNENIESVVMNTARKKLTKSLQDRETSQKWLLGLLTFGIGLFFWKPSSVKKITVDFNQYHFGLQMFWVTAKHFNFSHQFSDSHKNINDKINTYQIKDNYKHALQQKTTQLGFNHQEELRKIVTFNGKKMQVEGTLFQIQRCTFFVNFGQQYEKVISKEQKLNQLFQLTYLKIRNKFSSIQLSLTKYKDNSSLHGYIQVKEINEKIQLLAKSNRNNPLELLKSLKESISNLLKTTNYLENSDKNSLKSAMKYCTEFEKKLDTLTKQQKQIEVEIKSVFSKTQYSLEQSKNASQQLVRQNKI